METDPTKKFTGRAQNYARYRPSYPKAVLDWMASNWDLTPADAIADIGSGTGILSELFLQNGNPLIAVEPNEEMRQLAERRLGQYENFVSVNATAESTGLHKHSVDFITAGQAFHWFDIPRAKLEFQRILKPGGAVALMWNRPNSFETPYQRSMANLIDKCKGKPKRPQRVKRFDRDKAIAEFFGGQMEKNSFDNTNSLDWESYRGAFLSSSWAPLPGDENYEKILGELRQLFDAWQENNLLRIELVTALYIGKF